MCEQGNEGYQIQNLEEFALSPKNKEAGDKIEISRENKQVTEQQVGIDKTNPQEDLKKPEIPHNIMTQENPLQIQQGFDQQKLQTQQRNAIQKQTINLDISTYYIRQTVKSYKITIRVQNFEGKQNLFS